MEKTLVIFKPDSIQRGIVGEVLTRFERAGLKIIAVKMIAPDELHFHKHYEGISNLISRWGEDIYNVTLSQMTETPVIAMVCSCSQDGWHNRPKGFNARDHSW